jgi:hypothetical protein
LSLGILLVACATMAEAVLVPAACAGRVQEFGKPARGKDCDRCMVQATFAQKIRDTGAAMEFIELKNGVGILYTAPDAREVSRVQRAAEWARDELERIGEDPADHHLCSYCKASLAVFSKVKREVVRTGQGALFLMRSDDPDAVRALKKLMANAQRADAPAPPAPTR